MQYGNVKNYFFCIFLWKNLEIQCFIIIFALAFDKQIAKTAASGIRRLLSPLFPQIKNLREPYIIKNL